MNNKQRFAEMILNEAIGAAKKATRKGGNVYSNDSIMESEASFFFENHDDERYGFYSNLLKAGFKNEAYFASYRWTVSKEVDGYRATVQYVEGDVYVKVL